MKRISPLSRTLLILSAILLVASVFLPIWRIELDAPQYPEGLKLLIHADGLGGDVDIINGLNHYIGMATLHSENFVEFKVLPFIIYSFAGLCIVVAAIGRRKWLTALFILFVLFGIVAMIDFWRWEYDYGHNLDPTAAIIVPGMAYQPPLIGFKQLLNFGAYSIPDKGGWLFILSGVLMLACVLKEYDTFKKRMKTNAQAIALFLLLSSVYSCSTPEPEPIRLHTDSCEFCRMKISDGKFGAELVTDKGRIYKFDDMDCMLQYARNQSEKIFVHTMIHDYTRDNQLIDATQAFYIISEDLSSPMRGNIAAFGTEAEAQAEALQRGTKVISWSIVKSKYD